VNPSYRQALLSNCIFLKLAAYFTDTVCAKALITPNVYNYTELKVGKECKTRPLFIIITVAAKVTDRSLSSHK